MESIPKKCKCLKVGRYEQVTINGTWVDVKVDVRVDVFVVLDLVLGVKVEVDF